MSSNPASDMLSMVCLFICLVVLFPIITLYDFNNEEINSRCESCQEKYCLESEKCQMECTDQFPSVCQQWKLLMCPESCTICHDYCKK